MSEPDGATVDRRSVLAMLSAGALLAACSGGGSKARGVSSGSGSATAEYTGTPTTLDVPAVTSGRMTDEEIHGLVIDYAGKWLGSWADDTGGTGTGDIAVAIDTGTRIATVDVVYDGPIVLGSSPAPATYRLPLDGFTNVPDSYSIPTAGYGTVEVRLQGFGQSELRATNVQGHPEIDVIDLKAIAGPLNHASMTYKITEKNGKTVNGAVAFARGTDRPPKPDSTAPSAHDNLISGNTAAALITTDELSAAFGQPSSPPVPNGGKDNYAPGITVSNATAKSAAGDANAQWHLYRATDAASMQAYWHVYDAQKPVADLGDDAKAYGQPGGLFILYVLRGTDSIELTIADPAKTGDQLQAEYFAVAHAMLARMGGK